MINTVNRYLLSRLGDFTLPVFARRSGMLMHEERLWMVHEKSCRLGSGNG